MLVAELRPGDVVENSLGELSLVTRSESRDFRPPGSLRRAHVELFLLDDPQRPQRWEPPYDTRLEDMGWKIFIS